MKLDIEGKKQEGNQEDEEGIELKVKFSPISGSGIGRVNTKVLDNDGYVEGKPHMIRNGSRKRVIRLVADAMMEKGRISLRKKDMDKIGALEGDKIILLPSMKVGDKLQRGIDFILRKGE